MIAITAVVLERCRLIDKIGAVTQEQEEEERLSEQVMDIDAALGELAGPYQRQRLDELLYPDYEELIRSVESHYGREKTNS